MCRNLKQVCGDFIRGNGCHLYSRRQLTIISDKEMVQFLEQNENSEENKNLKHVIEKVSPYGRLEINLPCHGFVESLNPQLFPNMDQAIITFIGSKEVIEKKFKVNYKTEDNILKIVIDNEFAIEHDEDVICHIQLPIYSGNFTHS